VDDIPIRPEAVAAARWWVDTITAPPKNDEYGDAALNAGMARSRLQPAPTTWTPEQVEAFRVELERRIDAHCAETSWRPDEPNYGSGVRVMICDYGPDPVLKDAAEAVGLRLQNRDTPAKTFVWVNPGEVKAQLGYSAPREVVWSEEYGRG